MPSAPPIAAQLSQRLVELRRLGMHDGEIADLTGLFPGPVWRYRNEIASRPGWSSVQAIERSYEQRCRDPEK